MIYYRPFEGAKLLRGTFVRRPNRFVALCSVNGAEVPCHLPNPGRLWEILIPGAELILTETPHGKTAFTVAGSRSPEGTLLLHTQRTNDLVHSLILSEAAPFLKGCRIVRREAAAGSSRFDFLLSGPGGKPRFLEVKSCTLLGQGGSMFPDAPSDRAVRHVLELTALARKGTSCAVLFVVHSDRPEWFLPDFHTDPSFARVLAEGKDAVDVRAVGVRWTEDLTVTAPPVEIPIPWDRLRRSFGAFGGCMAVFRLDKAMESIKPAYWVAVSGASGGLEPVLKAMAVKRANPRTFWDAVRREVTVKTIPIRSYRDMGREIKEEVRHLSLGEAAVSPIADGEEEAALFAFDGNPLERRDFVDLILRLRMNRALAH